ncbi:MAG TPA: hypothetical protein VN231_04865 [Allosphingosinicella sp.]|nr:hypothetical protein [Allosphingosinicella sp.]
MGIERLLYQAEDLVLRTVGSSAAREAHKRRAQRKLAELVRRLRRSGLLLVGLLAALIGYSLFVAPIGLLTWLVAIPTVFLIAFMALFWPTRRRPTEARAAAPVPLDELAARAADGLLDRRRELPGRALAAADSIVARLHELQPQLGRLEADPLLEGEARRLICEHLPRLVDAYLALPPSARAPGDEASLRFAESLGTVAREFDHLLEQCCRDRHLDLETQHRFIESRYRDDERLRGG